MPERDSYSPGTPCWVELGSSDLDAGVPFYEGLFGWNVAESMPDTGGYRLAADKDIIRNVRKIEATVRNAQTMCELEAEYGSFRDYLQSHGDFEATVKDLRKRFSFLGDFGAYVFLYIVKEPVPDYHAFRASRGEPQK